jgi:hypothetical protein
LGVKVAQYRVRRALQAVFAFAAESLRQETLYAMPVALADRERVRQRPLPA